VSAALVAVSQLKIKPQRIITCCTAATPSFQVYDLAIGAAAGVASVLVSMPFDVIKTYMQTHGSEAAAAGVGGQVAAFWATGAGIKSIFAVGLSCWGTTCH
jgi:Mitochondrial carrier protein